MTEVLTEIEINKPLKLVAGYVANPDNVPEWSYKILSVKWQTEKPLKAGSEFTFFSSFRRQKIAYNYKVLSYLPTERLVMQRGEGSSLVKDTYTWAAIGAVATRLALCSSREAGSLPAIVTRIVSAMIRYTNQRDLRKIKSILEKGSN